LLREPTLRAAVPSGGFRRKEVGVEGSGPTSGSSGQSLFGVMPDVVKGLKDKPPLLFGIGAGVILVAVLAATADLWLVLIVAAVLVLALGAWLVNDALKRRDEARVRSAGGIRQKVASHGLKNPGKANVGLIERSGTSSIEQDIDVTDAEIAAGSNVGVIRESRTPERDERG
jgi:hypothetical protein